MKNVQIAAACGVAVLWGGLGLIAAPAMADHGVEDGGFDGSTEAWKKTEFTSPPGWAFIADPRTETGADGKVRTYLGLQLERPSDALGAPIAPSILQDEIELDSCDDATHAVLHFDHRVVGDELACAPAPGLRALLSMRSKDGTLAESVDVQILTQGLWSADSLSWLTEELFIPLPDPEDYPIESLEFEVRFVLPGWGVDWASVCDDPTLGPCRSRYSEVHLDQVELGLGTPRSDPPGHSVTCGAGAFVRAMGKFRTVAFAIPPVKSAIVPIERRPKRLVAAPISCVDELSCLKVELVVEEDDQSFELADSCVPSIPCPADLNNDGVVGGADLVMLLGDWGACADCPSDLNGDGVANGADLTIMFGAWGPCP